MMENSMKNISKEAPTKPVVKQAGAGETWKTPYCPRCGENVQSANNYSFCYCPHCGQRLNWSLPYNEQKN